MGPTATPDYDATAGGLRAAGIALQLDADGDRVVVCPEDRPRLTPELRRGLHIHHDAFLRHRLYIRACAFVAGRLERDGHAEGSISWHDAWEAFHDAVPGAAPEDAWLDMSTEHFKEILRNKCRAALASVTVPADPTPSATQPAAQLAVSE